MTKTTAILDKIDIVTWFESFEFWSFEFVSNFDIRFSDLIKVIGAHLFDHGWMATIILKFK